MCSMHARIHKQNPHNNTYFTVKYLNIKVNLEQ